jgi:diacylglycerol kinase family enzyme
MADESPGPAPGTGGNERPLGVPGRARALALIALIAVLVLAALLIGFLVRNPAELAVGLVGFAALVAGAWLGTTEQGPRRVIGWVVAAAGTGAIVTALLRAGQEDAASAARVVVALALGGVALTAARAAVGSVLDRPRAGTRATPPERPVLLCNPWSGGGKVERFGLQELATSLGVETVMLERGLDLGDLTRDAIARGADCLGMAGGDGSQAYVASLAVEHHLPFVCVSAGTRNHFALDLALNRENPRAGVHAFRDAVERRVDYATVNGRFFVNNVSLGVYATIVQQEGYREAKSETTRALLPHMLSQRAEPFDLQFVTPDGTEVDGAFLIMVSNNPYVLGATPDVSQRRRMDTGRLGVFAVTARTGAQAAEVVALALAGRSSASGHAYQFTCEEFEVRSRSGTASAGVDGEALQLETPLRFAIHPRGLHLLVPEGNPEAAARRASRDVHVRDLLAIARGVRPEEPSSGTL